MKGGGREEQVSKETKQLKTKIAVITYRHHSFAAHLGLEVGIQKVHAARALGHDAPTPTLLLHDVLLAAALHAKLEVPFTVVGVRLEQTMKAVAVALYGYVTDM